ncbi:MAG: alpha/beta hydrolase-fold protein [Burkholderiaceae bacterium]
MFPSVLSTSRRALLTGLGLTAAALLAGCVVPREARTPLDTLRLPAVPGQRADTLIVILPGVREVPLDIVQHGLVAQVRERGIDADVVVADTHIAYFRQLAVIGRLRDDVIAPARKGGYRRIWLAGISLGGYGALLYAMQHPGDIDGVVAIAPYVASTGILEEVNAAGGLAHWQAPDSPAQADTGRRLLAWLQGQASTPGRPPLYIGYGRNDPLQPGDPLMTGILPPQHILDVPGAHDWGPWRQIWAQALDLAFPTRTGARQGR